MNYYEILGVSENASQEEITAAFKKLVKELHPDRIKDEEERKIAEQKFKDITRAFNVLRDPEKRKDYDSLLSKQGLKSFEKKETGKANSEDFFKQAIALSKKGKYADAETYFITAIKRGMATAECYYKLALTQMNLPKRSKKIVENLENAINLDPLNAKYRLTLADFYLEKGIKSKAVYHYKRVLKIDPKNKRALDVLKALGLIRKKTFFEKVFKKLFKRG